MKKQMAFVIGQGSFVGRHVSKVLENNGFQVEASLPHSSFSNNQDWLSSINETLAKKKPEFVFLISAHQPTSQTTQEIENLVFTNCTAPCSITAKLADLDYPCGMVIVGTWWQYDENGNETVCNPYTASKLAALKLVASVKRSNLRIAQCVLFDIYGPDDKRPKFINTLIDNLLLEKSVKSTLGEQEIDLIHVEDAAKGIFLSAKMLKKLENPEEVLNLGIGSGKPQQLRKIIGQLAEKIDPKAKILWGEVPYRYFEKMKTWKNFRKPDGWTYRHWNDDEANGLIEARRKHLFS